MIRRTLLILVLVLQSSFSAFAQVQTVLQGLAVSYDNIQKATTSTVYAVENLTEAFKNIKTSGLQRFLWFSEKNLKEAVDQLTHCKIYLGEFTGTLNEETASEMNPYFKYLNSYLDRMLENLNIAITSIGEARDEIYPERIENKLKVCTPNIEQALFSLECTKSYINSFVIEFEQ